MISLVIPAYNPGPVFETTWTAVREFLRNQDDSWEVIFVLDGCTDGTAERMPALARDARIRTIAYSPNRGKGHAVRTGLLAARGEYCIFTDIDLAYGFEDILRIAEALKTGASVAIASRTHAASEIHLPVEMLGYAFRRHLQSAVFGAMARLLLPIRQTDTQAGLKGFSAEVVRHILPLTVGNGFGFDCELLTACHYCGIAVREVPVVVRCADRTSTIRSRTAWAMIRELWSIRRAWSRKSVDVFVPGVRNPAPQWKAA